MGGLHDSVTFARLFYRCSLVGQEFILHRCSNIGCTGAGLDNEGTDADDLANLVEIV